MMADGRMWSIRDRYGNNVYLTEERWHHITEAINHPDMIHFMTELQETIWAGQRKQDPLNPQKYRYSRAFHGLDDNNTHIVAIYYANFVRVKTVIRNPIITLSQRIRRK